MLIGKMIYDGENGYNEHKILWENGKIIQMQSDGIHIGMKWEIEVDNEKDAKIAAKEILEQNPNTKFKEAN